MKLNNILIQMLAIGVLIVAWFAGMLPSVIGPNIIRVPEDYPQIQQAIDEANPGDIIQVASGTYFENLKITKRLKLIGEGPDKTVVAKTGTVVFIKDTSNVEITGFSVRSGTYGIFLWHSEDILLRNNEMSNNKWNFGVWGDSVSHFVHDIDSSNMVDGKPMYYWVNQHGRQVPDDAGYVALINSTDITVKNMNLTSNEQGVLLVSTRNSVIENVTISGNDEGIDLRMSSNNTIRKNRLLSINWRAIYLQGSHNNTFYENTILNSPYSLSIRNSSGNVFYHNNFINNTQHTTTGATNFWDDGYPNGGNYWSNYIGIDEKSGPNQDQLGSDGIGDTPYVLDEGNQDRYPLMNPWDTIPPVADAGPNQTANVNQAVTFDASGSTDNVGIVSYEWDFGDGTTGTGVTTTHIYTNPGKYSVRLTVKDAAGNPATDTLSVTVVESPFLSSGWIPAVALGAGVIILIIVGFWRYKSSRK